jgi:hypothetical protein
MILPGPKFRMTPRVCDVEITSQWRTVAVAATPGIAALITAELSSRFTVAQFRAYGAKVRVRAAPGAHRDYLDRVVRERVRRPFVPLGAVIREVPLCQ